MKTFIIAVEKFLKKKRVLYKLKSVINFRSFVFNNKDSYGIIYCKKKKKK